VRNKRPIHGPGHWLCWPCFDTVTNSPLWKNEMWITKPNPKQYISTGGPCARCKRMVKAGEKAAKVTLDAPLGYLGAVS
jgi:hypothetical protein